MASATLPSSGGSSRPMMLSGHSGRLRYANAEDLPSYPSAGLRPGDAAASAAATLGWANIPVSPTSPTSARFGSLPASHPSVPRSHDALLAAGRAQRHQSPPAAPPSPWVSTAANLAFRATKTPPPATERPELSTQNSMRAAKGAMAGSRPRARSSPQAPADRDTDESDTGAYALSAATIAHRPSVRATAISVGEAGAVPYTTMDRQMFTSNPPVKPEVDEQNRAYVLHASALAMAKKMYDQQQKMIDKSTLAHARSSSFSGHDATALASSRSHEQPPLMYNSLQEAAYRLAQERLAKLQEEHDRERGLQEYYGSPGGAPQRGKFGTIKGKLTRRRSSSDGDLLEDKRRSEQIRKQMSLLNNKLSEVDEDKRTRDREALLAAAQRNVKAQLQEMDEKVQSEMGRVPHVAMDDWGRKALVAAQARFDAGSNDTAGKVDIGGGKLMDRSEVEKIAAKKVQPLLDEINERAEKEQARLEEEKLEEERRKEKVEMEKMRADEIQEIHKKLKDQQKDVERARKAEIKHQEKVRKEEEKALRAEQKHAAREEKQKEKEAEPAEPIATTTATENPKQPSPDAENRRLSAVGRVRALSISFTKRPPRRKSKDSVEKSPSSDETPTSPTGKVRAWLLSRFPRPRAKSTSSNTAAATDSGGQEPNDTAKKGFVGGAALARMQGLNPSTLSVTGEGGGADPKGKGKEKEVAAEDAQQQHPDSSMRSVAMAGRSAPLPHGGAAPGESSTLTTTRTTAPAAVITVHTTHPLRGSPIILPSTPPPQPQPRPASQVSQASIPASATAARSVSSLSSSRSSPRSSPHSRSRRSSTHSRDSGHSHSHDHESDDDDKFVEARSEPDVSGSSATKLSPPRPMVGGGVLMTGRVSPFRESRFSEILE